MKDFIGNKLEVGDEVIFVNNKYDFSICFIDSFDYDDNIEPMSFVRPYNCWIYNDKLIKVIRE